MTNLIELAWLGKTLSQVSMDLFQRPTISSMVYKSECPATPLYFVGHKRLFDLSATSTSYLNLKLQNFMQGNMFSLFIKLSTLLPGVPARCFRWRSSYCSSTWQKQLESVQADHEQPKHVTETWVSFNTFQFESKTEMKQDLAKCISVWRNFVKKWRSANSTKTNSSKNREWFKLQ